MTAMTKNHTMKVTVNDEVLHDVYVNRKYKARVFELLFSNKKELLSLYNAANKSNYTDSELLEINTLDNAIYIGMRNDVSFIIDSRINLYEHQSTYSPNLPLRFLMYISDLLSGMVKGKKLYSKTQIKIPTPHFLIFYNGEDDYPDVVEMKLSSAYMIQEEDPSLELKATMLNINPGHNSELLQACKALADYSEFTSRSRKYTKELPIKQAVIKAVDECIQEGILSEFLSQNKEQIMKSFLYEYDFEEHMRQECEDGEDNIVEKLIVKQLKNGKTLAQIAELIDEPIERIERVIEERDLPMVPIQDKQVIKSPLYEYDFEEHMRQEREDGAEFKLVEQIQKKLAKGKNIAIIADELEETEEVIEQLIKNYELE